MDMPLPSEPLTPAQKIIQETRSKQMAREQIEAQRKEAAMKQQQQRSTNPRETIAANANFNGSTTPPKSKAEPLPSNGHQQRFPSGAHQITRETANGGQSQTLLRLLNAQAHLPQHSFPRQWTHARRHASPGRAPGDDESASTASSDTLFPHSLARNTTYRY